MPLSIERNDIVHMDTDAIVNTANPKPIIGSGVDSAIHAAAGPQLLAARQKIGRIPVGHAAATPGFSLKARYVIHAVGPVWRGGLFGEEALLRQCILSILDTALELGCKSIAMPLISTGNYRFPKEKALCVTVSTVREYLSEHDMQITLVVFDRESLKLSEGLSLRIRSYIDGHYVRQKIREEYESAGRYSREDQEERISQDFCDFSMSDPNFFSPEYVPSPRPESPPLHSPAPPKAAASRPKRPERAQAVSPVLSLDQLLKQLDAGFSETLLTLIDKTGKKDSEVYNKANVSRQHFSKIRKNPDYKPTKATAIAFAIALELDMAQTRDLIGRAGYALTNSSVFDVIIMFFIERKIYDLYQINLALFEHDQSLLGQ